MIFSSEQIRRRLALINIRVGDILFCDQLPRIEIHARADNRVPGRFVSFSAVDVEDLINQARDYFNGLEFSQTPIVEDDGRKVPA
jgi:hypothetical protein